jgi:predicted hydrolase (HD superfamily)
MLVRDQAIKIVKKYLKEFDNIRLAVAVESILRKIAEIYDKNQELWGITGLLYNLDYEYCGSNFQNRGKITNQILDGILPEKSINAIKANNYVYTEYIPITPLDKCLIAAVTSAEFIMYITKKTSFKNLSDISLPFLLDKYNDSSFASNLNRNRIKLCEDLGLDLKSFLEISLNALNEISEEITL